MTSGIFNLKGLDLATPPAPHIVRQSLEMPVDKGIIAAVKRAFNSLKELYYERFPISLQRRVRYVKNATVKGCQFIGSSYKGLSPLVSVFRNTAFAGEAFFSKFTGLIKFANKSRVFSVFAMPISLVGLFKESKDLTLSVINKQGELAVESGLMIADHLGTLVGITTTFEKGLKAFGAISSPLFTTISTYLVGVGTILSLAAVGIHAKRIYDCFQTRKKFFKKPDFKSIVNEINSTGDSELVKKIGVSAGKKFKARMNAIYKRNPNPETNQESRDNLDKVEKALKSRITMKTISHAVKIVALTISIVASVILMFTPAAPAGYILLATSAGIGLSMLAFDYLTEERFSKILKEMAPSDCKEMWGYKRVEHKKMLENDYIFQHWQPRTLEAEVSEDLELHKVKGVPLTQKQRESLGDLSKILNWHQPPFTEAGTS